MTWRERVRIVVASSRFQQVITVLIVVNAAVLGLATSSLLEAQYGSLLQAIDRGILGIFVVEIAARLYAYRLRFFRDPWSCFDFAVIAIALVPFAGPLSILRSLRILRTLRLITVVPSMRRVVSALLTAIPGMGSIVVLLFLVLYVAAVVGTELFGATAPQYFGDLATSMFSLFQAMTGEGWPDIARAVMSEEPAAWIFFVTYILVSAFVVLNLFIAVVVSAMEDSDVASTPAAQSTDSAVLAELRALRAEVRALRSAGTGQEPPE